MAIGLKSKSFWSWDYFVWWDLA